MNRCVRICGTFVVVFNGLSVAATAAQSENMPPQYEAVLSYLGKTGDYAAGVLKVNVPRNDLRVTVDGVPTPTPFGFGGWLAMTPAARGLHVMMGDLVLTQNEVNPVMSALLSQGLEVTALHNHFFWETPRLFYMHVHGMGTPADLARRVKPALSLIGHVGDAASGSSAATGDTPPLRVGQLNTAALDRIIGRKGDHFGTVYKYTIGRSDIVERDMGAVVNVRMGLNTWAAFLGTDEDAVVAGDVAMLPGEITPVLKALREAGLDVVALHQHMTEARPQVFFLHYWGRGPAAQLAAGFKAVLGKLAPRGVAAHPPRRGRDASAETGARVALERNR